MDERPTVQWKFDSKDYSYTFIIRQFTKSCEIIFNLSAFKKYHTLIRSLYAFHKQMKRNSESAILGLASRLWLGCKSTLLSLLRKITHRGRAVWTALYSYRTVSLYLLSVLVCYPSISWNWEELNKLKILQ